MRPFAPAVGAVALAALALPGAALAQQVGQDRNVRAEDIPMQPLRDLNIDSEDVPPLLIDIANDPYSAEGLVSCDDIGGAIADIDSMLGPDFDLPAERSEVQKGANSVGRLAASFVGGLIPFRGIVREVTGASAKARELRQMVSAGIVRRGFLKGIGLERGCAWPARPADANVRFDEDLHEASEAQPEEQAPDEETPTADDTAPADDPNAKRFVSEPVVQAID